MDNTIKKTIALIAIASVLGVAYYGSYLPLRKTQMFIATLQDLQARPVTSIKELEERISPPLDAVSPIGQGELVRNLANSVLSFVQRGSDPASTGELIKFLHTRYDSIIGAGKGMSLGQDLYLFGVINEIAYSATGDPSYLADAKTYYEKGHELGPDRPQVLFGLFDVYRAMGDVTSTQRVADRILKNWPTAQTVRDELPKFLEAAKGQ